METTTKFVRVDTTIDEMGSFWSSYKDNSIGRAIHYIYVICGLHPAESCTFMGDGKIDLHDKRFAYVNWSGGYPHFTFIDDNFNKQQERLLKIE